jgi:phenylpropionate dioxygenase-like ring-hydroxylating dioxygenase large terminal subunit
MGYWIRNGWYVAMGSAELAVGKLAARTVLGEPIVLLRNARGEVSALEDRCAHRGAPLSLGKLTVGDTRVQCPYHGLEFDMTGQCVRNPHGNGHVPSGCRVRSYPVVERYGMLWVWTGDGEPDPGKLPAFDMLDPPDVRSRSQVAVVRMAVPYEYILDNLLDLSHVSYLHDGLLGNEETIAAETKVTQEGNAVTVERFMPGVVPPEYFDLIFRQDGKKIDMWQNITWVPPASLLLDVGATAPGRPRSEGTGNWAGHFLTPETETSTLYHFVAVRQNPIPRNEADEARVMSRLAELRKAAFAGQDEPMIRAQYENIARAGSRFTPRLLSVDAGVVRWRRVMDGLVKDEQAHAAHRAA